MARALPPAGRDHPPRRRRLGLRARRRPPRRRDPPVHGGDRDRRAANGRVHGRRRRRAATSSATRSISARPAGRRSSPTSRGAAPDHDAHPPGVRHRAGEAVPRRDHRLLADARLHLADRPRRVPDRRGDRAVHDVQGHRARSRSSSTRPATPSSSSRSSSRRRSCARGRASATSRPTTARSSAMTEVDGFLVSCGWGTYGFKAAPIVGTTLAELIATKQTPALIAPFALERFYTDTLVSELAAAAVQPLDGPRHECPPASRSPRRPSSARSRRSPRTLGLEPRTSTTSTAATRRRSPSPCSTASPTSPTAS